MVTMQKIYTMKFSSCFVGIALAAFGHAFAAEPAKEDPAMAKYRATLKAVHEAGKAKYPDQSWPPPKPEAVEAFRDLRFGMLIQWGPVSLTEQEVSWSRGKPTPVEVYDKLYQRWNPVKFNADEWAAIAKAAGMKYMVPQLKHHDGFCLWDTKYTDYNIMNGPFKRDITRELVDACRKQGIQVGAYYSQVDWHHPDSPFSGFRGQTIRDKYDMDVYEQYALNQTRELIEKYGPWVTLWNDIPIFGYNNWGVATIRLARSLQPDILVNDRTGSGGDFGTPEQNIGAFNTQKPWETCMPIQAEDKITKRAPWSWRGGKEGVKDLKTLLTILITIAGGDGNLMLNVGPTPDGEIPADQRARLLEMGQWLEKYGESIYTTRGGPYKYTKTLACTHKGNTVYLHVLNWDGEKLELPALPKKILKSGLLTGGKVELQQNDKGVTISVAREFQQPIDTIVKLELDGPAKEIAPIQKDGEAINAGDLMEAEKAKEAKTK